jgi:hypothetical protein
VHLWRWRERRCSPGGNCRSRSICLFELVLAEIKARIVVVYHDLGEQRLKNTARPGASLQHRLHTDQAPGKAVTGSAAAATSYPAARRCLPSMEVSCE